MNERAIQALLQRTLPDPVGDAYDRLLQPGPSKPWIQPPVLWGRAVEDWEETVNWVDLHPCDPDGQHEDTSRVVRAYVYYPLDRIIPDPPFPLSLNISAGDLLPYHPVDLGLEYSTGILHNVQDEGSLAGAHFLLDGSIHPDTVRHAPPDKGDLIFGNGDAPSKWDALSIGDAQSIMYVSAALVPAWLKPGDTQSLFYMNGPVLDWFAPPDVAGLLANMPSAAGLGLDWVEWEAAGRYLVSVTVGGENTIAWGSPDGVWLDIDDETGELEHLTPSTVNGNVIFVGDGTWTGVDATGDYTNDIPIDARGHCTYTSDDFEVKYEHLGSGTLKQHVPFDGSAGYILVRDGTAQGYGWQAPASGNDVYVKVDGSDPATGFLAAKIEGDGTWIAAGANAGHTAITITHGVPGAVALSFHLLGVTTGNDSWVTLTGLGAYENHLFQIDAKGHVTAVADRSVAFDHADPQSVYQSFTLKDSNNNPVTLQFDAKGHLVNRLPP